MHQFHTRGKSAMTEECEERSNRTKTLALKPVSDDHAKTLAQLVVLMNNDDRATQSTKRAVCDAAEKRAADR
jgi:hypothetical protein